jgi:hypothetical protein
VAIADVKKSSVKREPLKDRRGAVSLQENGRRGIAAIA